MTTIYPGITAAIVPLTGPFSWYGTAWTVFRAEGGDADADPSVTNRGMITPFGVVENDLDKARRGLPDVDIRGGDYFGWGATTLDLLVGDVIVSVLRPTYAFVLLGHPQLQFGPLMVALGVATIPTTRARRPLRSGLQIGLRAGL